MGRNPERLQQQSTDAVQGDHYRVEERLNPQHYRSQPQRETSRRLQRKRLREHFPQHDLKIREDRDRYHAGEAVHREPLREGRGAENGQDAVRHDVLAVHAQPEARQRYADLSGGDEAHLLARVAQDAAYDLREAIVAGCPCVDRRAGHADD